MEKMLEGKACLVTGAGRGIGKAAALLFAKEGGKIVLNDVDPVEVEDTQEEIRRAGGQALSVAGDVTAEGVPEKIVQTAVDAFGPNIDVIANIAGYTWDGMIHKDGRPAVGRDPEGPPHGTLQDHPGGGALHPREREGGKGSRQKDHAKDHQREFRLSRWQPEFESPWGRQIIFFVSAG